MPWLTPDSSPSLTAWTVYIPDGVDWFAAFWGAFLSLCEVENWQEYGDLTPDEVVTVWIEAYNASQG